MSEYGDLEETKQTQTQNKDKDKDGHTHKELVEVKRLGHCFCSNKEGYIVKMDYLCYDNTHCIQTIIKCPFCNEKRNLKYVN